MSWMDWGSRPKKSAATPPPLYLVAGGDQARYCHTCGRVIGSRKSQSAKASTTQVKFCSDKCKRHKLRPTDHKIEAAFLALLTNQDTSAFASTPHQTSSDPDIQASDPLPKDKDPKSKPHDKYNYKDKGKKKIKGDPRIVVACSDVERLVFGSREDPEKCFGRKKNRARRGVADGEWKSVDMYSGTDTAGSVDSGGEISGDEEFFEGRGESMEEGGVQLSGKAARVRKPQVESEVNGSIGGEKGWAERIEETPEMLVKRREGQRKAEEKEMVKCAARRAVVFGLLVHGEEGEDGKEAKEGKAEKGKAKAKAKGDLEEGNGDGEHRRLCEAVMNGAVVEPSYAKGDWGIRWREI